MTCERVQQLLLDGTPPCADDDARRELAEALRHAEVCGECKAAMADFAQFATALRDFDASAEPAGGWTAFGDRLAESVQRAGVARRWAGDPAHFPRPGLTIRRWAAAAAAACVVVGVAGFWVGRQGGAATPGPDLPVAAAMAVAMPTQADVARGAATFGQVEQDFGLPTDWVLVSGKTSGQGMGLATDLPPDVSFVSTAPPARVLLVRLRALHDGAVVADNDIAIIPGRVAKLAVPIGRGDELQYTIDTYTGSPARLLVSVDLTTPKGREVLSFIGTTIRPGLDGMSAGKIAASAGAYEVRVAFADGPFQAGPAPAAPPAGRGKELQ